MLRLSLWFFALLLGVLAIARMALWVSFGPSLTIVDFIPVAWAGLRFDAKVAAIWIIISWFFAMLWMVVRMALCRVLGASQKEQSAYKVYRRLLLSGLLLAVVASFFHHAYVSYYKQIFSPIIFGLFDDDTLGILLSIWDTFPVIPLVLSLVVLCAGFTWCYYQGAAWIHLLPQRTSKWRRIGGGVSAALLWIVLARGGVDVQPLNRQDATVTQNMFLNSIVMNAPTALMDAWDDQKITLNITRKTQLERLQDRGFSSVDEALKVIDADPNKAWGSLLKRRTTHKAFVESNPPHVVIGLMESWARHFLDFHSPQNNMMGAFEEHAKHDVFLRHFYSVHMGTHPSLEGNLFNSPITPITMGKYGLQELPSIAIAPFKKKGYRTVFIYSGSNKWRALDRTLSHQGFDELYDISDIRRYDPSTQANFWGAYDEYMFRFMQHRLALAEEKKEKVLIFFLTMTNHPPYSVPAHYQPFPINQKLIGEHATASDENVIAHAQTFQYATHHLGLFLRDMKQQPYGAHTLVAVSGDHSVRSFFKLQMPKEIEALLATPAYFYIPPRYAQNYRKPDKDSYSSHQSLFPSIIELALSDVEYLGFGESLFQPVGFLTEERKNFGLADFQTVFAAEGAVTGLRQHPNYFAWSGDGRLQAIDNPPDSLKEKWRYARARTALQEWWIQETLLK